MKVVMAVPCLMLCRCLPFSHPGAKLRIFRETSKFSRRKVYAARLIEKIIEKIIEKRFLRISCGFGI